MREPLFVAVLVASILINFGFGRTLGNRGHIGMLVLAVVANLFILGVFKYLDFGLTVVHDLFPSTNTWLPEQLGLPLPLGISFFTFQSISYLVDVYRKDTPAEKSLITMGAYVAMSPQLVADPIVRYKTIVEDLLHKQLSLNNCDRGIRYFTTGLAMKVLLADQFAAPADQVFGASVESLSAVAA